MKRIRIISLVFTIFLLSGYNSSWCWWFNESDQELLHKALKSNDPAKVEKAIDTFIKKENYSAILQIRRHVQEMIRAERLRLVQLRKLDVGETRKHLAPWVKIEQKADRFFKRTEVKQKGKQNSVP
ncbi:MAG: hypothetical protein NTZ51_08700 [Proteobacteria bacterium]|nr:hypothetical protein [Pseudomonadota bacterium]